MNSRLAGVAAEYERGLAAFLKLRSESQLSEAARPGRLAMSEKLGVLDMIMIHHPELAGLRPAEGPDLQESSLPQRCFSARLFPLSRWLTAASRDASEAVMRMVQSALALA